MKVFANRIMLFPFIFFIGIIFLVSDDMGIMRWYQLRIERNQIQEQIDQLLIKETELTDEINKLNNDKSYLKMIAQEKFHMVKPGEKVFRVIDRKKTD